MIPCHKKWIALDQLRTQLKGLQTAVQVLESNLNIFSDPRDFKFRDQLKLEISTVNYAIKDLEKEACSERFYSKWIFWIYQWSVRERFRINLREMLE